MNDVNLRVPSLIGKPGDTVTVPILIENATEQDVLSNIVSLDLLLTYDPTLVSIVDPNTDTPENEAVRLAGISANWSIEGISNPVVNLQDPGTIDLALIKNPNSPPTPDSDRILEIDFTIAEGAALGSSTSIDLQADEAQSRIGIDDQDSEILKEFAIADESLQDGQIGVAEISIGDVSLAEGNEGNTEFNFTVSLLGGNPLDQNVTVDYTIENDTATAGEDYTVAEDRFNGTLTFAPGEPPTQNISVAVIGDTTFEDDQTFFVNLSNFSGGAIADAQGVGTITNDDALEISINDDVSIVEGNEGNQELTFTVSLSTTSDQPVTVDYTIENDTATAGEDYTVAEDRFNGTLTFEPGQTTPETISVQVSGDTNFESDETFFVNLSNPSRGAIANPQGVGTINNDDIVEDDIEISQDLSVKAGLLAPDGTIDISGSLSDAESSSDRFYKYNGENYYYDFFALPVNNSVDPGNTMRITVTSTSDGFNPLLMILDSDGQLIPDSDDQLISGILDGQSPTQTTISRDFPVPSDERFFISIESFDADGIGNYQLDIDII